MKRINKILFVLGLLLLNISVVLADVNTVNIYLFHSDTCPHCKEEITYLDKLEEKYDNIKIYKYEISDSYNSELLYKAAELYDTTVTGVPFTVIGEKYFKGFSYEGYYERFVAAIDYYSENGYYDKIGEYLGDIELPKYEVEDKKEVTVDKYINDKTSHKISIFGHKISLKDMALPFVSALIGLVDGFNPCAMWVLLFLISILIGMNDKKRMLVIGLSFLLTSAFIYLLFMVAWLNAATLLLKINYVRLIIGLIALAGAFINLRGYIRHRKDNGCEVIDDKKRSKIFDRIKKFTHEKSYLLAILGAMALAISVNIVELACSAGLPVMFIEILSMNDLNILERIIYIGIYMIFFLLDDIIVFLIAVRTMELTGFSTKYGKLSKLVGGLLLLIIGLLLIFKPGWLMFNF